MRLAEVFSIQEIIPSAGQGIIALQCREIDKDIISILKKVNHEETYKRAHAERNVLKVLEGDCQTAIGVYSKIDGEVIVVEAELFSIDGSQRFYEKKSDRIDKFKEVGKQIGQNLKLNQIILIKNNMHILLTRPLEDCSEMILKFKSLGHQVSHIPLINIEKVNYEKIKFSDYGGIIFTSANAVKFLDLKI